MLPPKEADYRSGAWRLHRSAYWLPAATARPLRAGSAKEFRRRRQFGARRPSRKPQPMMKRWRPLRCSSNAIGKQLLFGYAVVRIASRSARRCPGCGALLFLLLTGACSLFSSSRSELLGESYLDIQQNYVRPMPAGEQALAGMSELTIIDHDLTLEIADDHLVLERGKQAVAHFTMPQPDDWRGWGDTSAAAVAAAASGSPAISEMSDDAIDAALLHGTLSLLDRYSRYVPPKVLATDSSQESRIRFEPELAGNIPRPALERRFTVSQPGPSPVSSSVWVSLQGGIALVRIERFTPKTGKLLRLELDSAPLLEDTRGIILDMRDNPGGDLDAAIATARLFLQHGILVTLEERDPSERQVVRARDSARVDPAVPLIVLINSSSASAAEIVAAALQENGRALVVGSPSRGKGTVQTVFDLANGGELWVTSAFSRAPSGYLLQGHGVVPDVCATLFDGSRPAARARFLSLAARPRLSLSESDWEELRLYCPDMSAAEADDTLRIARSLLRARLADLSRLESR
ncbi:MAG TPA: S41 family peptidase [Stellaceae bacterium]|nr:S41 family peptidase [Stellaceae bacterium]